MDISLTGFRSRILESLLNLLWRQWSAIGVSAYGEIEERRVIDPEALLMLTLTVARHDARLFDEVMDWLEVNGDYLNVQRLQNLVRHFDFQAQAQLSAVAEWLEKKPATGLKWKKLATKYTLPAETPLFFTKDGRTLPQSSDYDAVFRKHGLLRPPLKVRGLSQPFPNTGEPALLLRLRALFGVNLRCEILCLLGLVDQIHPSLIAKSVGLGIRATQNILAEMVRSGAVQVSSVSREKFYALAPGILDQLLRPHGNTPWIKSVPLFRALEALWLGLSDPRQQNLDRLLLASEWRRLAKEMAPYLGDAGWGQPLRDPQSYKGETYYDIFIEDVVKIVGRL